MKMREGSEWHGPSVTTQLDHRSAAPDAWRQAHDAAQRAGVTIHEHLDHSGIKALQQVVAGVWRTGQDTMLPGEMLHALQHAGNYVVTASRGDRAVGATIGFFGQDEGRLHLHSHITGVLGDRQLGSIGHALKLHQRAWCLDRGITTITWTFDPMVRRNAYFNIAKLGAEAVVFRSNYYGTMTDGVNSSDETDRILVRWRLLDDPAKSAARTSEIVAGGQPWLSAGRDLEPVIASRTPARAWCDVPDDFAALRATDPLKARRWRQAFRETLGAALCDEGTVVGFTRERGYLVCRA